MPPATINCEVGPSCIFDLSGTIERELSEDMDTGLLGDLVNLFAAIARVVLGNPERSERHEKDTSSRWSCDASSLLWRLA